MSARNVRRCGVSDASSSQARAAAYWPRLNSVMAFCKVIILRAPIAPRAKRAVLMTRIIHHEIQLPETTALLALEESETDQRRSPGSDLRRRRKPLGRCLSRAPVHVPGSGYLFNQQLTLVG